MHIDNFFSSKLIKFLTQNRLTNATIRRFRMQNKNKQNTIYSCYYYNLYDPALCKTNRIYSSIQYFCKYNMILIFQFLNLKLTICEE